MALELRLQQKMSQQLVMTPQLQQAIKLLQLNHLEMADVLREEMEQNPMLEEPGENTNAPDTGEEAPDNTMQELANSTATAENASAEVDERPATNDSEVATDLNSAVDAPVDATPEPTSSEVEKEIDWEAYLENYSYSLPASAGATPAPDDLPPFEASLTKSTSLHDHLRWQIQMQEFDEEDTRIAVMLVEEINDDGYLSNDAIEIVADELGASQDHIAGVLSEMQRFDPLGVCARDLRECLLLQCARQDSENPLLVAIVDRHLKNVEKRNYQGIAKDLKISLPEVGELIKLISQLEPRPGRAYTDQEPQYITPDIFVQKVGDEYVILLNEDGLPKLRISSYYRKALSSSGGNAKSYIQEKLRSAAWLIRSIHMRQRTIYRVMESILKFQQEFFDQGVTKLKPLILKDVAEDVEMHESTISRVTTNKYVHTPQGIFELKYFFNSSIARTGKDSIASESVRDHIKRLIDEEDPRKPHSDQQIVKLLGEKDIEIARRTVAKYREMLKIASSSKRKQVF